MWSIEEAHGIKSEPYATDAHTACNSIFDVLTSNNASSARDLLQI